MSNKRTGSSMMRAALGSISVSEDKLCAINKRHKWNAPHLWAAFDKHTTAISPHVLCGEQCVCNKKRWLSLPREKWAEPLHVSCLRPKVSKLALASSPGHSRGRFVQALPAVYAPSRTQPSSTSTVRVTTRDDSRDDSRGSCKKNGHDMRMQTPCRQAAVGVQQGRSNPWRGATPGQAQTQGQKKSWHTLCFCFVCDLRTRAVFPKKRQLDGDGAPSDAHTWAAFRAS